MVAPVCKRTFSETVKMRFLLAAIVLSFLLFESVHSQEQDYYLGSRIVGGRKALENEIPYAVNANSRVEMQCQ